MSLAGKVAVVTGGAKGIGRAISRRLCEDGATVVILDVDLEGAERVAESLSEVSTCAAIACDLSRPEEVERATRECLDSFGRIDVLVNNAARLGDLQPVLEDTYENWNQVLHANLIGPFLLTRAAASDMRSRNAMGKIVNIAAIQSSVPLSNYAPYAASKGGLVSFTKSLAVELADTGIIANAVEVGCIYTDGLYETRLEKYEHLNEEEFMKVLDGRSATLLGRHGRPEDVAAVVSFLASDENRHMVGEVVRVDGGRMISRRPDPLL